MDTTVSRRAFVTGAAAGAAGIAATAMASAAAPALADEAATPADAQQPWDAQPASVADQVGAEETHDVVIVGAGNVGVPTALYLAQAGADVLVVEQSGAACMWAGDIDALDSQIQKDMDIQINKEYVIEDLLRYNQGKCDQNLIRQWAYNAGAFVDWYQEQMQKKGLEVMVETRSKRFYPEGVFYNPQSVHTAYKPPLEPTANSMGSEIAIPPCSTTRRPWSSCSPTAPAPR